MEEVSENAPAKAVVYEIILVLCSWKLTHQIPKKFISQV
jgi:hypothetical protein